MITFLMGLAGLLAPGLPHLLRFAQDWLDKRHEFKIGAQQVELEKAKGKNTLDQIGLQGTIDLKKLEEMMDSKLDELVNQPSVPLVASTSRWINFVNGVPEFANRLVRSFYAYSFFWLYATIKVATFFELKKELPWQSNSSVILSLWTPDDMALFVGIVMFYFSARSVKYAMERYNPRRA